VSLRARLIIGLLALAAVGLVLLAGITYVEQRHFLMKRVDQQLTSSASYAGRGHYPSGGGMPLGRPGDDGDHGEGPPPDSRGPGGPAAGTWLIDRTAAGAASNTCFACFSATTTAPVLPAKLTTGKPTTVKATNLDKSYRILATARSDGGMRIVAVPLTDTEQTLRRLLRIEGLVIAAILVALGALSWLLVRLGLRPLDRMGVTAGQIAGGDLSHRIEVASPRSEVGRLGVALNRMLDRLEAAFAERQASEDRLRRFLADASHELRTPLASIRGYAELFRIGAARAPADTEKAMTRIEAEATRMGVLVEDLLTLARLDEVRDAVRAEVDVARLAADAVQDARATAPDRDIELATDGPSVVDGDPSQLRQVLANLLRNALVHTPEGTSIEVAVRWRNGDGVVLEVRDHGHGLPAEEGDALFERFWRTEAGRERGKAGAGLGLAIVAGIVGAHGGEVHAANAEGGGARFTVVLPRRRA
jgi:two-component system OmpR family sensor kinase